MNLSPFLKTGEMFAAFQSSGTIPVEREFLNIISKQYEMGIAAFFRTMVGILSGPEAFCSFNLCRSLRIPSLDITISGIDGAGGSSIVGIDVASSLLKTDWYCLFRIDALSAELSNSLPLSFSGGIPDLSRFAALMCLQNLFWMSAFGSFGLLLTIQFSA